MLSVKKRALQLQQQMRARELTVWSFSTMWTIQFLFLQSGHQTLIQDQTQKGVDLGFKIF